MLAVAKVYAGTGDIDPAVIAQALLNEHAIPDNPYRVYTEEGIRNLRKWQEVWVLQDREDAGEKVKIPEPPEFAKGDFRRDRYFQIRGKLNVPRERFLRFEDVSPIRYGWNGWRDRSRAMAQIQAYTLAEQHPTDPLPLPTTTDPRRCGATIGLWESLPDLKRWGDPATREGEHAELLSFACEACQQAQCPCEVVESWQKWRDGKLHLAVLPEAEPAAPVATVEERLRLLNSLVLFGHDGATLADLDQRFGLGPRLLQIMDDLVASGEVAVKGRGKKRRFSSTGKGIPT